MKKILAAVTLLHLFSWEVYSQTDSTKDTLVRVTSTPLSILPLPLSSPGKLLDEVIVTSNKFPQKQSTTGKVITVINRQMLDRSAGQDLGEVLARQAGIIVNGSYENKGTNQTLFMRGASSGRTLVTVDGIPMSDVSTIGNEFDLNFIPIDVIEQIEICRGPQSTLYGSDAIGGVVNIITRKDNTNKLFNVAGSLSGGSKGTFNGNGQIYGSTQKGTSYSVQYNHTQTDGFSTATDTIGNQDYDNDYYRQNVFNGRVSQKIGKRFLVNAYTQYSRYKTAIDAGAFEDDKDYTVENKNFMLGAGVQYELKKSTIYARWYYNTVNRHFLNDSGYVNPKSFSKYEDQLFEAKANYFEVYSNIQLRDNLKLLVGSDYRFANTDQSYMSVSQWGVYVAPPLSSDSAKFNIASLYSSLVYNVKSFTIELGGRLNHHNIYGNNFTFTFNPSYSINKQLRVFGSIASGFKSPSLYELYSPSGNKNLQPETSVNYEAGAQYKNDKLFARATGFYRDIKDDLAFDYYNYKYYNSGYQKVKGIELEVTAKVGEKITLGGNYTFLKGREETQSRTTVKDTVYNYLLSRPQHSLNISIGMQITPSLYVNLNTQTVSKKYVVSGL